MWEERREISEFSAITLAVARFEVAKLPPASVASAGAAKLRAIRAAWLHPQQGSN